MTPNELQDSLLGVFFSKPVDAVWTKPRHGTQNILCLTAHSFGTRLIKNVKKMSPKKSGPRILNVLGYSSPRLHEGKRWYVDFYAADPSTGEPRRKKYYVDSVAGKRARREFASSLIERLGVKLRSGWNPWAETKSLAGTKLLDDVLETYLNSLKASYRQKSVYDYCSRANVFREYIASLCAPPMYVFQFDAPFVTGFLDWVLSARRASARTRNNYRGWCSAFAEFMVERGMLPNNPVANVRKARVPVKNRESLTPEMLHALAVHLRGRDRHFLLACMMEYYTFIRPHELRHVRLSDISLKDMSVFVPASVSKNRRNGKVALNEELIKLMLDLKVFENPCDFYLFGRDFTPSGFIAPSDVFNKRWAKLRKEMKWPESIKFYSLKDSGIRDLSNDAGVVTARDQARHSDISTTNIYLCGKDMKSPDGAKHFKGFLD